MNFGKVIDIIRQVGLFKSFLAFFILTSVALFQPKIYFGLGMSENFIDQQKDLIVFVFAFSFLMTFFTIIQVLHEEYKKYRNSDRQIALRYLKKSLTQAQQEFINEMFFDEDTNKYQQYAQIDKYDERGLELERYKIVEKGKEYNLYEGCVEYNLLSYSYKFFNDKVRDTK